MGGGDLGGGGRVRTGGEAEDDHGGFEIYGSFAPKADAASIRDLKTIFSRKVNLQNGA
jgi:hypothetical protein